MTLQCIRKLLLETITEQWEQFEWAKANTECSAIESQERADWCQLTLLIGIQALRLEQMLAIASNKYPRAASSFEPHKRR
jgi:hypothetical protein